MKKIMISLAVCLILLGAGKSFAQQLEHKMHTWEIGPEVSHLKYVESGVMYTTGMMTGIAGSYAYHKDFMVKTEAKASYGKVRYDSKNTGSSPNNEDYLIELRLLGGYDLYASEKIIITPYLGFGYRYLNDDSGGSLTNVGAWGYEREANYYYSPVGVEAYTRMENGWDFGVVLEYDYFWKGLQISHLEDGDSRNDTIENDQNSGYGFRAALKFRNNAELTNGKFSYIIEPFIKNWQIKRSDYATGTIIENGVPVTYDTWYEPKNTSTEFGVKFSLIF